MPTARRVIALAIAAYLTLAFIERFVLVQLAFTRLALPLLAAAAVGLACIGAGFLCTRSTRVATNLAVGYPIFGTACFLVGLVKIASWTMVPLVVVFAAVAVLSLVKRGAPPVGPRPSAAAGGGGPTLALAIVLLCGFAFAQAPPVSLDELAYHLAVPWTWAKEGRVVELPLLSHSYFPLGVESADLPLFSTLGIDGGVASHFLHLIAALAAMVLLWRGDGLVVAAIATAPVLAVTAGWSLVDWNLLAVAIVFSRSLDDGDHRTSATALAAGLLTKYTFLPFALIVLGVALWKKKTAVPWLGFVGGAVFFVRNLILTGNPFAPFFSDAAPHVSQYRDGAYLSDYVFDGRFIDESLGSSLLSAAAATGGLTNLLLILAGTALFLLAPSARILVPFFVIPAAHASLSWRPLRVFVALGVALQVFFLAYFVDRSRVFALLGGSLSEEEFVAKMRPSNATIPAIDAALPADSRTLVIGLNEMFWFRHRVRGGGNFDGPRMSRYLAAGTPEALRERLRGDGITHVAVLNVDAASAVARKQQERETVLSPEAQKTLAMTLDRYAVAVTAAEKATLFQLR